MNKLGYIVSFEGIDYCGKSSQILLLKEYFKRNKIDCVVNHALEDTELCKSLEYVLREMSNLEPLSELLLFEAARHQIVKEIVEPAILNNKVAILDRYIDSSMVYQGYLQGVNLELIETINKIVTYGFEPDLTFLLDIKKETFLERISKSNKFDMLEKKAIECYEKIAYGYHQILKANKRVVLIDGEQEIDQVHKDIIIEVSKLYNI
jgi:dTMP kinase